MGPVTSKREKNESSLDIFGGKAKKSIFFLVTTVKLDQFVFEKISMHHCPLPIVKKKVATKT